jgi:hypothetical protein
LHAVPLIEQVVADPELAEMLYVSLIWQVPVGNIPGVDESGATVRPPVIVPDVEELVRPT